MISEIMVQDNGNTLLDFTANRFDAGSAATFPSPLPGEAKEGTLAASQYRELACSLSLPRKRGRE